MVIQINTFKIDSAQQRSIITLSYNNSSTYYEKLTKYTK